MPEGTVNNPSMLVSETFLVSLKRNAELLGAETNLVAGE